MIYKIINRILILIMLRITN